ncbi:laminin subunit alpha-2 isoform X2 [Patella vulgata]|nr:laminin subunit alpha-2 isoform X2 [Patella vulgata]
MVLVQDDINDIMMKNQANRDVLRMVNRDLDNLPKDLHNKIDEISRRAMDVNRQVNNTSGRIQSTINKISKELEPELKKLRDVDMKALISHIQLSTHNASDNVNNLKNLTEIVIDSSKQAKRLNADVSGKILRLREKIRLAREIANDMKLSLSGNGECFRSFRSVSQPSTANSIDFAFKVNKTVKDEDMLLVLLQKSHKEYMSLELRNKFVHFRWNVGSGEGLVIHDQEVTMASDEAVEQDRWYRVTAKRIGRIGLLKVKSMARLAPETKERNASSSIGSSLLKFDSSTAVYLAGYPNKYNVAPDISSNKLVGCIGDVYIDDEKVGVFNFKNSESSCQACVEVPSEPISSNIYHFDGTGYSSLHRGRYRDDKIYISFSFKTYWENAILHFSGDEMGDFMSIELVGGKVVLQYYMGGISIGRNKTNKTYNTNKWVKVNVDRNKLNALLTVDNERIFISSTPGKTGLDLKDSPMFFGGIPKSLDISKFQKISPIENTNLLGCMKDVSVGAISADVQNLFTGDYVGMTAGCKDAGVRTIGFYGDGYSMYEGQSLISGDTDISVSFVTKKPDALLLLSTDIPQLNYYSLSVKNGIIIAQFTVDSVGVSLVSNYSFNDGFLHNIGIIKSGRRVALMVNDEKHMERRLPSGATAIVIGADGSLYLGGTQRGFTVGSNVPTTQKLDGCLSNIIINGGLIALDKPKQYERADIGRCSYAVSPFQKQDEDKESQFDTKEKTTTATTTTTTTLPSTNKREITTTLTSETTTKEVKCAVSTLLNFYSGATSFGNTDASYAQIKVQRRDISKSFNISFDFRTFYPDALFGFLTNADHSDYIAAQLKDGYIHVSYIRSGPYSTSSNNKYDDGQWHSVYITKDKRDLAFIVDGVETRQGRIRAKLDIDAPIYIGGLPDDFEHSNTEVVRNSLRGCMKNLIINKDQIDLADTKIISGVGQCYRDVEKGAYFTGTSWGAYSNNVRVKKDFSIELYFKTQKSNGVLLTSSTDDLQSAVAIEIVNGQVKFTMKNGGFFITVQSKIRKEFHYCDKKWHRVQARLFESNLGLRIDKDPENIASSSEEFQYFETRSPLIIGGIARIFSAQGATSITVGYTGCMRDITIDNQPIGWYDLIDFNGIRRTACPQQ